METQAEPIPLPYHERPLTKRERKLLNRLWLQHDEGVLWSRFFLRMLLMTAILGLYVCLVAAVFGWQSPAVLIVGGMLLGMLLMNFTFMRMARRNWPTFMRIINWQDVEQLRRRDAEVRNKRLG